MRPNPFSSRRHFLRAVFAAAGTAASGWFEQARGSYESFAEAYGVDATVVARVPLPREVFEAESVLHGEIYFREPPRGPINVEWIDGIGRVVNRVLLTSQVTTDGSLDFSFSLAPGLTYRNWLRISVNGVPQVEGAKFLLSPARRAWDDFHTLMWAAYPDGYYQQLASVGVDSTIAYRDDDFAPVLDNNFHFYVEQMAWEIFAVYHKRQSLWHGWQQSFESDRENWQLLVRKPCLNDPKTDDYLRQRLTRMVRMHKAFRPLFYNIADELGHGDQIQPTDFCHSEHCTPKFAEYLRSQYGSAGEVGKEWGGLEIARWDDDTMRSGLDWDHRDLMIARTTTDRAFDSIAFAGLRARYGGVIRLNREWNTTFPEPSGVGMSPREEWEPVIAMAAEARGIPVLDEKSLERKLGPLEAANVRWGKRGGWKTDQKPTRFRTWAEVTAFLKRYYAELGQIRSTEGWNVAAWCDFRNFMDATFAAAIRRAAAVCKAEDPEALCATEGGQAPAAFGWYNYEQVVKSVDVIEPYNIANNAEVIRSLNPTIVCLGTHGFQYQPGKSLTAKDRVEQQRKIREVWWQLFHGYRAAIIWDDLEANYRFIDAETRQLTPAAEAFSEVFQEVRGGIGRLILNSRRTHDGIALHYSHGSVQVHWLLENLIHARDWVTHHVDDSGHFNGIRNSWTKVIEDVGLQYNFVSREQIEAGKLNTGEYRAFVMPQSVAVSSGEADQIRQFVRAGGLLIGDYAIATMNERGRDLGFGQLDDVFGIRRGKSEKPGSSVRGVADFEPVKLANLQLQLPQPAEFTVVPASGQALAASGQVPVVIVNKFGNGRAVFLNLDIAAYAAERLRPETQSSIPDLVENILALAGVRPRLRVLGKSGKRVPGAEVVFFENGAAQHVAVFRNPQFDAEGLGDYPGVKKGESGEDVDNAWFEAPADVMLEFADPCATYDIRGRSDLGVLKTHKCVLDAWRPLLFTRASQAFPRLRLGLQQQVRPGERLELRFATEGAAPRGAARVIRLELETPDGRTYDLYTRNYVMRGESGSEAIPLAWNDPRGRWRVNARDVGTGQALEAGFELV